MVRGLVMGPGTDFIVAYFNPWIRNASASYTGSNPYQDGAWSGPEFLDPAQITLIVHPVGGSPAGWWSLHTQLLQAFRPIRTETTEPEIHWRSGGKDFMMYARPRALSPEVKNLYTGDVTTSCSLEALDPSMYSGGENGLHSIELSPYATSGGLAAPLSAPLSIFTAVAEGRGTLTNAGIDATSLMIRIDGPVVQPRFLLVGPDGAVQTFWIDIELLADQWLEIDTGNESIVFNGVMPRLDALRGALPLLAPGESTIEFRSASDGGDATAHISWRDRW